jgi:UDP-sugar transporter A1/2/3
VLLAFGIAVVQVPEPNELLRFLNWEVPSKLFSRAAAAPQNGVGEPGMNASKGFAAVVAASVISGLTGVYFEKVVKDSAASISIWTRNMQLSFYSLFPALFFGVLYKDGQVVREDGFFVGYNLLVWITILLQVLGGLTVAMCVAQMDNIIKNFAVSISIVFSFLIEVYFFETSITINVSFYEPSAVTLLTFIVCIRRLYCNISDLSIWQTNVFISIMRCEKYLQMLLLLPRWGDDCGSVLAAVYETNTNGWKMKYI